MPNKLAVIFLLFSAASSATDLSVGMGYHFVDNDVFKATSRSTTVQLDVPMTSSLSIRLRTDSSHSLVSDDVIGADVNQGSLHSTHIGLSGVNYITDNIFMDGAMGIGYEGYFDNKQNDEYSMSLFASTGINYLLTDNIFLGVDVMYSYSRYSFSKKLGRLGASGKLGFRF